VTWLQTIQVCSEVRLIDGGPLDAIDHEHLDRGASRFEPQPELLLQRRYERRCVLIDGGCGRAGTDWLGSGTNFSSRS